jgi:uncharacterized protein YdeI (YjbR/CyaY-like superfamily)
MTLGGVAPVRERIRFFKSAAGFREWLASHHAVAQELWVGYYKKATGRPSLTWPESVDQALCFGWIDGIRRSIDGASYTIRFTPRRPRSTWSAVNIKRVEELERRGLMQTAGRRVYEARREDQSRTYGYEQRPPQLPDALARLLRRNNAAWAFFQTQPPSYRKVASWWVISAKKEETRLRRLRQLIADSAQGRPIRPLTRSPRRRTP